MPENEPTAAEISAERRGIERALEAIDDPCLHDSFTKKSRTDEAFIRGVLSARERVKALLSIPPPSFKPPSET
jgi:hypothetical protein